MKASAAQKWLVFLILTGLALFIGFYFYRYLNDQYQTETTYPYTVAETVRVSGIVLREEFLLEDKIVEDGVASYIVGDGTKVSKDSLIAEVYYSESDAGNVQKLRELENRRLLLEKAQDPGTTSYAHTDVLNKQIASEVGAIIDAVQSDNLTGLSGSSDNLLVLMNTKQIATGKQENYHDAIELIEAEEAYFQGQIQEEPETISSPKQGYFMRTIDGLENMVELKELDELTPEDIRHLTSRPSLETPSDRVGKLMTDHNWYYAVIIESQDADRYREGSSVTLDFNISGVSPVPATIEEVNPSGGAPETVVVFRCDYINEALINLRVTEADVSFKSITGLRVSKSAVRFSGIQKGVYINMGEKRIFRPITVIYEDVGYVLCREVDPEYYENGTYVGLQQYDEVIIEGGHKRNGTDKNNSGDSESDT